MRIFALLVVLLCGVFAPGGAAGHEPPARVLFVGNSLTYVGNVPAIYSALAQANGQPVASDMIVRGGATLAQRVADGSVADALASGNYTSLVLQERGGDLICSFGPASCGESRAAIGTLADLARRHGVRVVLLGTYQSRPEISQALVEKESTAARDAGIAYAEVSEKLQRLRGVAPELTWFADDGTHPGKDLALLNALVLYEALHGSLPAAGPLTVAAPIYGSSSGLTEELRRADDPPPLPSELNEAVYKADTVGTLLHVLRTAVADDALPPPADVGL